MAFFNDIDIYIADHCPDFLNRYRHVPLYYGVQYNHGGGLRLRVDEGDEYRVEGSYVFISHPGTFVDYGPVEGRPRDHHFVCFAGDRVQQYIASGLLPIDDRNPLIRITHSEKFYRTLGKIIDTFRGRSYHHDRLILMLEELLLQLHEQDDSQNRAPPWQAPRLLELMEEIEKAPEAAWDFAAEARKANMSLTHFRRLFKRLCNDLPPQQFLIRERLRLAEDRLLHTSDSIGQIAAASGFDSEYYFSRIFKRKNSISPSVYRREFAGQTKD